jgi:hypothetical protein
MNSDTVTLDDKQWRFGFHLFEVSCTLKAILPRFVDTVENTHQLKRWISNHSQTMLFKWHSRPTFILFAVISCVHMTLGDSCRFYEKQEVHENTQIHTQPKSGVLKVWTAEGQSRYPKFEVKWGLNHETEVHPFKVMNSRIKTIKCNKILLKARESTFLFIFIYFCLSWYNKKSKQEIVFLFWQNCRVWFLVLGFGMRGGFPILVQF